MTRIATLEDAAAHDRRSVQLGPSGGKFVVVADTHGRPHEQAGALIAREKPDGILHAGDIGDWRVLDELAKIAPVFAVRGNIDPPAREVPEALTLDLVLSQNGRFRLLLLHIAVNGLRLRADAVRLAQRESASLVVCGHSHVPFIGQDRGIGVFNPGSIGPRRFQLPIVFGVLQAKGSGVRMHHVSCETGQIWTPFPG